LLQVSCGSRHTLAVSSLGAAYSWGWGACGQLGHGNDRALAAPRLIHVLAADGIVVTTVGAGGIHSAAVTGQGHLYTWGGSCYGQTGLGPTAMAAGSVLLPQKVLLSSAITAATSPAAVADGIDGIDGTVEDEEAAPLLVTSISCGGMHMAAVTPEGTLYAWGRADSGQLGIGSDWVHDTDPHNNGLEWPQQVCGPLKGK
ncbi:unnamed protein product, partial [Phaeothamnion confervicola]